MADNYTINSSTITLPYEVNRSDRTDLFTDKGTKNEVISNAAEGTIYFVKNSTEHIILPGSWFDEDPEVSPLHFIKKDGKWELNSI